MNSFAHYRWIELVATFATQFVHHCAKLVSFAVSPTATSSRMTGVTKATQRDFVAKSDHLFPRFKVTGLFGSQWIGFKVWNNVVHKIRQTLDSILNGWLCVSRETFLWNIAKRYVSASKVCSNAFKYLQVVCSQANLEICLRNKCGAILIGPQMASETTFAVREARQPVTEVMVALWRFDKISSSHDRTSNTGLVRSASVLPDGCGSFHYTGEAFQ